MSRISALTTFRLIGSPINPDWPYWRPWPICVDIFSLAGVIPGLSGVGVGSGSDSGPRAAEEVLADPGDRLAAPLAIANELSDSPATHASAQVLVTKDL